MLFDRYIKHEKSDQGQVVVNLSIFIFLHFVLIILFSLFVYLLLNVIHTQTNCTLIVLASLALPSTRFVLKSTCTYLLIVGVLSMN